MSAKGSWMTARKKQWDTFICKPLHNAPEESQSEPNLKFSYIMLSVILEK